MKSNFESGALPEKAFLRESDNHIKKLMLNHATELKKGLKNKKELRTLVYPSFLNHIITKIDRTNHSKVAAALKVASFGDPAKWFPLARSIERRIIAHIGPTNSGKTHAAITRLKSVQGGAYCGPLRLLAMEMYDRLNAENYPCALVTGEALERPSCNVSITVSNAPYVSSTVEMFQTTRRFDCVVIDEIQMMGDRSRGWAFTRAFLGAYSSEIHVCGEESIVPLLKRISVVNNESLEIIKYERLSPLFVGKKAVSDKHSMQRGDCFVAFSRDKVYQLKKSIEEKTKKKCAVIYGQLPMESRRTQAKLFNNPESDYHFLAATDAIGMGLNLNIGRIVFNVLTKFNGEETRPISVSQLKQIAGRAGRFRTAFGSGEVTTYFLFYKNRMKTDDLKVVKSMMETEIVPHEKAGVVPTNQMIADISRLYPECSLEIILQLISGASTMESNYFLCDMDQLIQVAKSIRDIPMRIDLKYNLLNAPIKLSCGATLRAYRQLVKCVTENKAIKMKFQIPNDIRSTEIGVEKLEVIHRVLTLYNWFNVQYPRLFPKRSENEVLMKEIEYRIMSCLDAISTKRIRQKSTGAAELLRLLENNPVESSTEEIVTFEARDHDTKTDETTATQDTINMPAKESIKALKEKDYEFDEKNIDIMLRLRTLVNHQ